MAVGEIIGAAIGILMLIVVAYLVVGSTLSTAELVVNTQKDVTLQNEARMRTDLQITFPDATAPSAPTLFFNLSLNNTGSETIMDFSHMDLFSFESTAGYRQYIYDESGIGGEGKWTILKFDRDEIHPRILDPGEAMWICATYVGERPTVLSVATGNGVYTSTTI